MVKKIVIALCVLILLAGGAGAGLHAYYNQQSDLVYKEVFVEAGTSECDVSEFLKREESSAKFTEDSDFDARVPGDYPLKISATLPIFGEKIFDTVLHVQDTTAPEVTLAKDSVEMYTTAEAPTVADLIESINDVTNCTVDFKEPYDFTTEGEFDIEVVVTDTSGNQTIGTIPCKVIDDVTPPEIKGVEPLTIAQGDSVSY